MALSFPFDAVAQQTPTPEERIAALVNKARVAQGLSPVGISSELTAAAEAHARDMAQKGYMDHQGRDGSSPQQRALRHGYTVPSRSAWIVVEVISARPTPETAVDWWLNSGVHRGVLLRGYFREIGVGYAKGGPYGQFWTISFGCRPNVLPVTAEATAGGASLSLTNEECMPSGGADQIGRATDVMVSDRSDFDGASWQPFSKTKKASSNSGQFYVKYRDARGREATSSARLAGASLAAATTDLAAPITTEPDSAPSSAPGPRGVEPLFDLTLPGTVEPARIGGQR